MTAPAPPDPHAALREGLARALYEHDSAGAPDAPGWGALEALDPEGPGRYRARADALVAGPLSAPLAELGGRAELEEEARVLRRQRMGPERERELLEANNRALERARTAEAAHAAAEAARTAAEAAHAAAAGALGCAERERDTARESEAFWQRFAFDADELATRRLVEALEARGAAERAAVRERARRERAEGALRLFADRADGMPREGWASELAGLNHDLPLWWFHAARVALEPPGEAAAPAAQGS